MKKLEVKKKDHVYWDLESKMTSGMSLAKASKELGVGQTSYYYWKKNRKPYLGAPQKNASPTKRGSIYARQPEPVSRMDEITALVRELSQINLTKTTLQTRLKSLVQDF